MKAFIHPFHLLFINNFNFLAILFFAYRKRKIRWWKYLEALWFLFFMVQKLKSSRETIPSLHNIIFVCSLRKKWYADKKISLNWRCECGEDWSHFLWINLEYYFCDQTMLFLFFQMPNGTIRDSVANTLCEFVRTRNDSERSVPFCQLLPIGCRFAERK